MDKAAVFRRAASGFNRLMLPLVRSGPGSRLLGGSTAVVTYTGRRSGREVTLPVSYRREKSGDVVIGVMAPDAKTWWRNFTGEGAPMHLRLGSQEVDGHAIASRGAKGGVTVRVSVA